MTTRRDDADKQTQALKISLVAIQEVMQVNQESAVKIQEEVRLQRVEIDQIKNIGKQVCEALLFV